MTVNLSFFVKNAIVLLDDRLFIQFIAYYHFPRMIINYQINLIALFFIKYCFLAFTL